ncbi:hypothetical protein CerSpe_038200 [Prunus speciosa]|uniref:Uncharacterized protein n=1 Tax=Prunus dulcis TaxID=3755 RepID=A0AAD4ZSX6_PRUDU|nr:hypothetical protein L3X38_006504 [Prunus dulcis]
MITRSNLAEQLREYQIRSKHDWASVSFFSSTSNHTLSRVDVVLFVIWELQVRLARKKKRRMLLPLSM